MIFGYFTLFVALIISAIAEYYSIIGLTSIFSSAFWPVVIMGAALGVGKITAAIWLKLNWEKASWVYKCYLVPAVMVLMLLTSVGCFGYLSKAHSDQSLVSGDVQAKIAVYDEKIKTAKDNIDANRKAIRQLDEAVDQVMARSTTETGADKAVSIRRSQSKERARLISDIEAEQKKISGLNEQAAPIRAEVRKVEAEVGPIKYIAAFVYGDNPDTDLLEKAVRWVIILIVAVFDPLALVLILAAQQSIKWAREDKVIDSAHEASAPPYMTDVVVPPTEEEKTVETEESLLDKHPYLTKLFVNFENLKPMVHSRELAPTESATPAEKIQEPAYEPDDGPLTAAQIQQIKETAPSPVEKEFSKFPQVPETAQRIKTPAAEVPETKNVNRISLQADNIGAVASHSDFGTKFPDSAVKSDMFLRVDYLPNKLFKFNGQKWIEVDKTKTDSYTYDEQYILFLVDKLQSGEYDIDQLSASEQELVELKLKEIANGQT